MKKLLILSLIFLIGCSPKFKVGDCAMSQYEIAKVIKVEKYGYSFDSYKNATKEALWYSTFKHFEHEFDEKCDCRSYMEKK